MSIIKIETNIPVTGTAQYADYAVSKNPQYGDQLKLKGEFNGERGANVYLPIHLVDRLKEMGIVSETLDKDKDGNTAYKVVRKAQIEIVRKEDGKKKVYTITETGASGWSGAASPGAPAAQRGRGAAPSNHQQAPPGAVFRRLCLTMKRCIEEAQKSWPEGTSPDVISHTAHCLFIECNKRDVLAQLPKEPDPPATVETKEAIDNACRRLELSDEAFVRTCTALGIPDYFAITEPQAKLVLAHVEKLITEKIQKEEDERNRLAQQNQQSAAQDIPFSWLIPWLLTCASTLTMV